MLYVKGKTGDMKGRRIKLHDDNVFCACPGCGDEVCVDLVEVINGFDFDLYSLYRASFYCAECSKAK